MKLTVLHVFNAAPILAQIIAEKRPLPLKGSYRLARMHGKLMPEFQTIAQKRDAMIIAYNYKAHPDGRQAEGDENPDVLVPTVPPAKIEEFQAKWADLVAEEIEVDVQPVPLSQLDLGDDVAGAITALELMGLGELVLDDTAPEAKQP